MEAHLMVAIRQLQPSVEIALPRRTSAKAYRGLQAATVVRSVKDHPSPTPQPTPCRLWQGAVDNHGYGTWHRYERGEGPRRGARNKVRPHRWVVEQIHGPLRPDQVIMHLCDNPLCFRYDHLRIGTTAENNADMIAKGRHVPRGKRRPEDHIAIAVRDATIQRLWLSGLSRKTIAETMGCSYSCVQIATKGISSAQVRAASGLRREAFAPKRNPAVKARGGY
jgi:hypothetical protein